MTVPNTNVPQSDNRAARRKVPSRNGVDYAFGSRSLHLPPLTLSRCDEQTGDRHKMTDARERAASKVPEVTLVFWIIKIAATTLGETGGDTVTMTLNWGYLVGTALFLSLLLVAGHPSGRGEEVSSVAVLGDDCRLHDRRHHHGRLCRPLARHRLCRRIVASVRLSHGHARRVVLVAGLDFGRDRQHAEGGSVLLGCDYLLADSGNGFGRLDGR